MGGGHSVGRAVMEAPLLACEYRLFILFLKSTRAETPSFVATNELQVSREHPDIYHLVRAYNIRHQPAWFPLRAISLPDRHPAHLRRRLGHGT